MTHACSYVPAYKTYEAEPCSSPPSHVIYVDALDEDGYVQPYDYYGEYVCARHSGSVAQAILIKEHPATVHIVPLEPKLDQS